MCTQGSSCVDWDLQFDHETWSSLFQLHINLRENGDSGKLHFNGTIFIRYFVVGNQPIFLNNEI